MKIKHDMKLLVAVGKSRMAKSWQNREILWSELLDKLSTTTRTRETVAEYAAMSKDDKNRCKDVGGFVAGYLKGGKRSHPLQAAAGQRYRGFPDDTRQG